MSFLTKLNSWPKRHRKISYGFGLVLLLIVIVLLVIKTMSSPAVGSISQAPPTASDELTSPKATAGKYNGQYVSFTYPEHFEKISKQAGYGYLEVAGFYATDHTTKEISVGVLKDTIATNSGISYRRAHPELYREELKTANGIIFVSTKNGYERTAFIVHNDLMATVTIKSPNGGDLKAGSELILNTLKWLQ